MTRFFAFTVLFTIFSSAAWAVEAPDGQAHIDGKKILRGSFVEERQDKNIGSPIEFTGNFVVAPAYGLLWIIAKPLPTTTIITSAGMVQDLGGLALKLPSKNLQHLYKMVGDALAGNWGGLDADFSVTATTKADHWQMLLIPRPNNNSNLHYSAITVSGTTYVENIVLTKNDNTYDTIRFSNEVLAPLPLTPSETAAFNEGAR